MKNSYKIFMWKVGCFSKGKMHSISIATPGVTLATMCLPCFFLYAVAQPLIFAFLAVIVWPDHSILFPVISRILRKHDGTQP